jgi:ATP-dependent DNA helicase RecG
MRPEILFPLFAPVESLKGLGPRLAKLVGKAAGPLVIDLIWHLPTAIIDRRFRPKLGDAVPGQIATLTVRIEQHLPPASSRAPYRVRCSDDTGWITLTYFHVRGDWLARTLPVGEIRIVSGLVESFDGQLQMPHPDHVGQLGDPELPIEPVYGLTAGLSLKVVRRAVTLALGRAKTLPEWLDPEFLRRRGWAPWLDSLQRAHDPADRQDLEASHPARQRLAYDELLADQLALALVRGQSKRAGGIAIRSDGTLVRPLLDSLPFALTRSQSAAIDEIAGDLASPQRMSRLLQGDVGSGKTVVAMVAMLSAVEAGYQTALMAPTELLARQHAATLAAMARPCGIEVAILTGREQGAARTGLLQRLADGTIPILVGTHALFQQDVAFKSLGLIVVDEQHRFGVEQRAALAEKGSGVNVLAMTATPIPRSLMLANYGDMDSTLLREKPAGRQPITTRLISVDRIDEVIGAVGRALDAGHQVYWVCPMIDESESADVAAVTSRHATLVARFGSRVGLLHGRMKQPERERAMAAFSGGETALLVSTTVIEVGVDVPRATIMVVEHAERFGLAQLHQLRGRVGRGTAASSCLLLFAPALGATARARLETLRDTDDGFRIAETDLTLRGTGEILGTRQSGLPRYRIADVVRDSELLEAAHRDARLLIERDGGLGGARGAALRILLYLFQRDAYIKFMRSG